MGCMTNYSQMLFNGFITAIPFTGVYYLVLLQCERSTVLSMDINIDKRQKLFSDAIDTLTRLLFMQ